jgi:hypothetical protein
MISKAIKQNPEHTAPYAELVDETDWDVFDRIGKEFTHRGNKVSISRLQSYCMAAIENMPGVSLVDDPVINRMDAVSVVVNAIESKYPSWFDPTEGSSEFSDASIQTAELTRSYYCGRLDVGLGTVDATERHQLHSVVVPLLAIVLNRIEDHKEKDKQAAIEKAQEDIKKEVFKAGVEPPISEDDITEAVEDAISTLDERDHLNQQL